MQRNSTAQLNHQFDEHTSSAWKCPEVFCSAPAFLPSQPVAIDAVCHFWEALQALKSLGFVIFGSCDTAIAAAHFFLSCLYPFIPLLSTYWSDLMYTLDTFPQLLNSLANAPALPDL